MELLGEMHRRTRDMVKCEDLGGTYFEPNYQELMQIGKILYRKGCNQVDLSVYLDWIYIPLLDITIKYNGVDLFDCRVVAFDGVSVVHKFIKNQCYPKYTVDCCRVLKALVEGKNLNSQELAFEIGIENHSGSAKRVWTWFHEAYKELAKKKLEQLYWTTIKAQLAVASCEENGVRVDKRVHQGLVSMWELQENNLKSDLQFKTLKEINRKIQGLVKDYFPNCWTLNYNGLLCEKKSENTSNYNANQISRLNSYVHIRKLLKFYGNGFAAGIDMDSRIHCNFDLKGHVSGKIISKNPDLQKFLDDETRKMFVATPGNLIVSAVFSQVELKIAAILAKDEQMLKSLNNQTEDFCQKTSKVLFNTSEPSETHKKIAETFIFAMLYGKTPESIMKTIKKTFSINIAKSTIERTTDWFNSSYRNLKKWVDLQKSSEWSITPLGRKQKFKSHIEKISFLLEGATGELMLFALENLPRRLRSTQSQLICILPNELIFESPISHSNPSKILIKALMEEAWAKFLNLFRLSPFPTVKTSLSPSWKI